MLVPEEDAKIMQRKLLRHKKCSQFYYCPETYIFMHTPNPVLFFSGFPDRRTSHSVSFYQGKRMKEVVYLTTLFQHLRLYSVDF
jgi:hypothetical protein